MRHSELQIGNYVIDYDGNINIITGIGIQSEPAGSWAIVEFNNFAWEYPDDLKPIPIDEGWLNILGFTIKEEWPAKGGYNFYNSDRTIEVSIGFNHGIQISKVGEHTPCYMIEYVHELQNIRKLLNRD